MYPYAQAEKHAAEITPFSEPTADDVWNAEHARITMVCCSPARTFILFHVALVTHVSPPHFSPQLCSMFCKKLNKAGEKCLGLLW